VQVLKKCDGELATFVEEEKKVKTKFIDLDYAGNDKLLNQLFLSWQEGFVSTMRI